MKSVALLSCLFSMLAGCSAQPATRPVESAVCVCVDDTQSFDSGILRAVPAVLDGVLETLRPSDTVTVLTLQRPTNRSRRGEQPVATIRLPSSLRGAAKAAVRARETILSVPVATGGTTDIGRCLYYTARLIEEDRAVGRRRRYDIVAFTDGEYTGRQSGLPEGWVGPGDVDWRIALAGVDADAEGKLRGLIEHSGFADPERVLVTVSSHIRESTSVLPRFLKRRIQPDIQRALAALHRKNGEES